MSKQLEVGSKIMFRRLDGKVCADTVRGLFVQEVMLEPMARNQKRAAVILTDHSWCFVDDIVKPKAAESLTVAGVEVVYKPKLKGYVAVFGPEYAVHFTQPTGDDWFARKPLALEPIARGSTLQGCVYSAKMHYDNLRSEAQLRARKRIQSAFSA